MKEIIRQGLKKPSKVPEYVMGRVREIGYAIGYTTGFLEFTQYPRHIVLYIGLGCNIKCSFCGCKYVPTHGNFDFNNIYKLEKPIKLVHNISITAYGEPMLSPNFDKVLDYIFSVNDKCLIDMATNGTLLTSQFAEKISGKFSVISVSINAATKEVYNREMENGDFDKLIKSISSFQNALPKSDRCKTELHLCAYTDTYKEMPELVRLARKIGIATVRVGQYMANHEQNMGKSLLNIKETYNNKVDETKSVAYNNGVIFLADKFGEAKKNKCFSPFSEIVISNDGNTAPCCWSDFGDKHKSMGNIYETSFDDVWFGAVYKKLRRHPLPFCYSCPYLLPFDDPRVHIPRRMW